MEQDQQEQRQQRDRREIERHRDRLVLPPVEQMRRGVEADERQAEDGERPRDPVDRARTTGAATK